jgi:hypothetical protein
MILSSGRHGLAQQSCVTSGDFRSSNDDQPGGFGSLDFRVELFGAHVARWLDDERRSTRLERGGNFTKESLDGKRLVHDGKGKREVDRTDKVDDPQ